MDYKPHITEDERWDIPPEPTEYQVMNIQGRKVQVPLGASPREIEKIRRRIRQEQANRLETEKKRRQRKETEEIKEETENMEPHEFSDFGAMVLTVSLLGAGLGTITGVLYLLALTFTLYGIPGVAVALTVGGAVIAATTFAVEVLRNRD